MLRSHRVDAENLLTTDAQIYERCYTQYYTYNNVSCSPPFVTATQYRYYTAVTAVMAASTFVFTASAIGNQTKDTDCANFSINNTGKKTALNSVGADNSVACWNQ